ncbi:LysR family transcriptional regulator [Bordetella genomosp. 9]|uniref:LysR family transcriptional regulator n=1 Tax=Bordetella genomosp. 9 TaxID=1416803 RepID=A0A1W6YWB9_9BORD|nr:LysR family transcriptional regulator [Bordetella genomosp. 9]ARP85397.1 LysR family transcriptional regulator [Bordetella genomosp. 9]ARP89378.1 LysR family transcriptional regulator [Bordetella genomosp. 9]
MLLPQWLRTFAVLAELRHFTRTADRLGLTQAAVSQHVRHLEQELGPLLVRRPRQIELTPAGEALLQYCRDVERAGQHLRQRLGSTDAAHGDISIVTPGSIGLALYPLLLDLQQLRPGLAIRHRFAPDVEVLEAVLQNRYELGVLTMKPDDPRLAAEPFAEEPLELVAPADARIEQWDDLVRLGFIDHPDGQAMASRLLSRRFPGAPGIRDVPVRGFSNQVGLILEPVARGLGFTVLPRYANRAFRRQHAIQIVECGTPVVDRLWLIHRSEWPLSPRARSAVTWLRENLAAPLN